MSHPKEALQSSDHNHSARRRFLAQFSTIGLTSTLFPGLLWGKMQEAPGRRITPEMIRMAEQMAGLEFNEAEREAILERVNQNLGRYQWARNFAGQAQIPEPPLARIVGGRT